MDYEYRDLRPHAGVVRIALIIWAIVSIGYAATAAHSVVTIAAFNDGAATMEDLTRIDAISLPAAWLMMAVNLVTIVLVAIWIYRANRNAHSLSDEMEMTPGWNIGWFFVPIFTFWKPFQGLAQSWRTSVSPVDSDNVDLPGWMRLWWGCWIISSLINNVIFRLELRADSLDDYQLTAWLEIICLPFELVAVWTLMMLVKQLSQIQHDAQETREHAAAFE
jgi:hypothetical protein